MSADQVSSVSVCYIMWLLRAGVGPTPASILINGGCPVHPRLDPPAIGEFRVDWKTECGQLNIARVAKTKKLYKNKKSRKHMPVPT